MTQTDSTTVLNITRPDQNYDQICKICNLNQNFGFNIYQINLFKIIIL